MSTFPSSSAAASVAGRRSQPRSASHPTSNATNGVPMRYPPVDPLTTAQPCPPSAYTGSPTTPIARYSSAALIPSCDPSSPPVSSTPNVSPVIGTGPIGSRMLTCATAAMKSAAATTSAASRASDR